VAGASTPLETVGVAAKSAGYVNCNLALENLDMAALIKTPTLRISLAKDIAGAVVKVAKGLTPEAVMTSVNGGQMEVGILVPDGVKPQDVVGQLASSGRFVSEAAKALESGCCKGTKVTMTKEPSLVEDSSSSSAKSASVSSSSDEDESDGEKTTTEVTTTAAKGDSGESDGEKTTTEVTTTAAKGDSGSSDQPGASGSLIVTACTVVGLGGAAMLLSHLL